MSDDITYEFHRGLVSKPDCRGCPLAGSRIIPPEGNPRAKIAIVGEGPSRYAADQGRVFIGPTGNLLDKLLARADIERNSVWLTNSHLCTTKVVEIDGKITTPDQVSRLAAKHCKSRLDEELAIIRPRVIIGLGTQSVRSVYAQNASMKGRRGAIHTLDLAITDRSIDDEEEEEPDEEDGAIVSSV
jgi:uracil-DNA glycosylase